MPSVENNDKSGIKMEDKKFHLTWETYNDHLRNMLHNMMVSSELTDVTLVCEDKTQFKAHKFVLKECSSVFKSIINTNQQNQSIFLRGIFAEEMESILQFIYLGSTTLSQIRMNEFFNVAKALEIKEISNATHNDQQSDTNTTKTESDDVGESKGQNDDIPVEETKTPLEKFLADGLTCNECFKVFSTKRNLNDHKKGIHIGIKYKCNFCENEFTQKSSRRKHIKKVHVKKENIRHSAEVNYCK